MRTTDKNVETARTAARRSSGIVLTAILALSLIAGLLLLVQLQARAQAGPEAVEAELTVEKRANTDIAAPGDLHTYTISIQKQGADLTHSIWP